MGGCQVVVSECMKMVSVRELGIRTGASAGKTMIWFSDIDERTPKNALWYFATTQCYKPVAHQLLEWMQDQSQVEFYHGEEGIAEHARGACAESFWDALKKAR